MFGYLIESLAVIVTYAIPLAIIIALVIFIVRKLNSIEKRIDKLEKLINEKSN